MNTSTTEAADRPSVEDLFDLLEEHRAAHRDPWVVLNEMIQADRENNYAWDRWLAERRRAR